MKNRWLFFMGLFLVPLLSHAQFYDSGPFEVGIFGGTSTYGGDLKQKAFTYGQSNAAFGLYVSKTIHNGFGLEAGFNIGKLSGADSLGHGTDEEMRLRNLDFQAHLQDVYGLVTYNILDENQSRIVPYVFVGLAAFHYRPYTEYIAPGETEPERVLLTPLRTEGQGLSEYPEKKPYSLKQFAIPLGVGVKYAISPSFNIGAVFSFRKTFTDYLDDVSGTYADETILSGKRGPLSSELAFRTNELPGHENDPYPAEGMWRGSSNKKDFYFFTGIRLSFKIHSKSSQLRRALNQLNCPPGMIR